MLRFNLKQSKWPKEFVEIRLGTVTLCVVSRDYMALKKAPMKYKVLPNTSIFRNAHSIRAISFVEALRIGKIEARKLLLTLLYEGET